MTIEADVVWPYHTLAPRTVNPEIIPANTGGGRSITSVEQVVSFDAGYWAIDLMDIPFASRNQKLAARAIAAGLDGRIGTCLIPVYDYGPQDTPPWPVMGGNFVKERPTIINPDGTFTGGSIVGNVAADAAQGATTVSLMMTTSSMLWAGMMFSIGVRLYKIKSVDTAVGGLLTSDPPEFVLTDDAGVPLTSDGTLFGITITPPLREAITDGTPVNFSGPVVLARLKTDNEMRAFQDDYAGRTLATIHWEEAINP